MQQRRNQFDAIVTCVSNQKGYWESPQKCNLRRNSANVQQTKAKWQWVVVLPCPGYLRIKQWSGMGLSH